MRAAQRGRATSGASCYWTPPAVAGCHAKEKIPISSCRMGLFLSLLIFKKFVTVLISKKGFPFAYNKSVGTV